MVATRSAPAPPSATTANGANRSASEASVAAANRTARARGGTGQTASSDPSMSSSEPYRKAPVWILLPERRRRQRLAPGEVEGLHAGRGRAAVQGPLGREPEERQGGEGQEGPHRRAGPRQALRRGLEQEPHGFTPAASRSACRNPARLLGNPAGREGGAADGREVVAHRQPVLGPLPVELGQPALRGAVLRWLEEGAGW